MRSIFCKVKQAKKYGFRAVRAATERQKKHALNPLQSLKK